MEWNSTFACLSLYTYADVWFVTNSTNTRKKRQAITLNEASQNFLYHVYFSSCKESLAFESATHGCCSTPTVERHKFLLFCMQVNLSVNKSKCHVSSRVNFAVWVTKAVECSCAECRWREEVAMPVLFTIHNACAVQTCCPCACCVKISHTVYTCTSCYDQFWQSPHFLTLNGETTKATYRHTSFGITFYNSRSF